MHARTLTRAHGRMHMSTQVCAHRLVNGFSRNDWVLGFVYRAGTLLRTVAGLRPITASGKDDLQVVSSSTATSTPAPTDSSSSSPASPSPATTAETATVAPAPKTSTGAGAVPVPLNAAIENLWEREGGREGKRERRGRGG